MLSSSQWISSGILGEVSPFRLPFTAIVRSFSRIELRFEWFNSLLIHDVRLFHHSRNWEVFKAFCDPDLSALHLLQTLLPELKTNPIGRILEHTSVLDGLAGFRYSGIDDEMLVGHDNLTIFYFLLSLLRLSHLFLHIISRDKDSVKVARFRESLMLTCNS